MISYILKEKYDCYPLPDNSSLSYGYDVSRSSVTDVTRRQLKANYCSFFAVTLGYPNFRLTFKHIMSNLNY